jgi:hypothetical protein
MLIPGSIKVQHSTYIIMLLKAKENCHHALVYDERLTLYSDLSRI